MADGSFPGEVLFLSADTWICRMWWNVKIKIRRKKWKRLIVGWWNRTSYWTSKGKCETISASEKKDAKDKEVVIVCEYIEKGDYYIYYPEQCMAPEW